jgi:hypothetical protein
MAGLARRPILRRSLPVWYAITLEGGLPSALMYKDFRENR